MKNIRDYKCTISDSIEIDEDTIEKLNIVFPEVHTSWEAMSKVSKKIKELEGVQYCRLPFCHTVEAEALGGDINLGNEKYGPRASEYIYNSIDELLKMKDIDFTKGRINEVLLACKKLKDDGEFVILEISGPITILSTLIDIKYIFKGIRKEPELMVEIFNKLSNEILSYASKAIDIGVDILSYADSTGGVNILGPKMAEYMVDNFSYSFLHELEGLLNNNTMVYLCPKTTYSMIDTEKAVFKEIELGEKLIYIDGLKKIIDKTNFVGETCIKNINKLKKDRVRAIILKELEVKYE